jgi:hypothetical protein
MSLYAAAAAFMKWMDQQVLFCARGDNLSTVEVEPRGRFWLGRLASEESVAESGLGDRGERLEPCAVGLRIRPHDDVPWTFQVKIEGCVWMYSDSGWKKHQRIREFIDISINDALSADYTFGRAILNDALARACGFGGLSCELHVEVQEDIEGKADITILLVNTSPKDHPNFRDTNLYECSIEIIGLMITPFTLESLPDSFRYDRRVQAYGVNCGIEMTPTGTIRTVDTVSVDRKRISYWNFAEAQPDFTFATLHQDPIPSLLQLVEHHAQWGLQAWGKQSLENRARRDEWSQSMMAEAVQAAEDFSQENKRLKEGLDLIKSTPNLLRAFKLMNLAMSYAANGRYSSWRPFQIGFLLANLLSVVQGHNDADIVDVVWFATGGGKTETYLGLLITAALYDRLEGKLAGITAWSRFPLRMLSLQQTQRFADAMAGAEIVRREAGIAGDSFSLGFLVGQGATPNSLKEVPQSGEQYDVYDEDMPDRCRVLLKCPFCHSNSIFMDFDRRYWRLEHQCRNEACPWPERALPFYIVDDEIYRFLPTVIVGTLDKAASIAIQAGMRGLVSSPLGKCSELFHGYTYAPRSSRPNGCLVPSCVGQQESLEMPESRYAPSFRLQDELHLLKDSLGAVDAHYESLLDHLEYQLSGRTPKILASSATLTGYERQIRLLYQRAARVFPVPGPSTDEGFWTSSKDELARRYVAVAPRGVTIEYAIDRTVTELQRIIRNLIKDPESTCAAAGVDPRYADDLVSLYGVDVIYGNTLRDLDAVTRSLETQIDVEGPVITASLTGRTDFEEVRNTLDQLQKPEASFDERLHVVTASSMMSHGVDIDRLNVMVMLGIPLTASEFIQATARIGRSWPGTVYVMQKMARERDAGIFRCFDKFVLHGDRFVEPIAITRRSRKVLNKTVAGLFLARILAVHEAQSGGSLTTVSKLRAYFNRAEVTEADELAALISMLKFETSGDEALRKDLQIWLERFFSNLEDPGGTFKFPKDLSPTGPPMRSLRDVEEEVPIIGL